jgi:UDP-N-acetylmuramyl pentapeptide synthase
MKLQRLLRESGVDFSLAKDMEISGLSYDSRLAKKGDLFFAMKGVHVDGHEYLD